jgi:endoglucanase
VSAKQPTGFDITDVSKSAGYTLSPSSPPVWAYLQPGGFVSYPMNVEAAGTYAVQLFYSTTLGGQASNLLVDGAPSGVANLPATGDWGTFALSSGANVQLPAGSAVLTLAAAGAQPAYNLQGLLLTPVAIGSGGGSSGSSDAGAKDSGSKDSGSSTTVGKYPLAGAQFYVNAWSEAGSYAMAHPGDVCAPLFPGRSNLLAKIVDKPQGVWVGGWNANPRGDVAGVMSVAGSTVPILVIYNIPGRDCGGYSSGGTNSVAGYEAWVLAVAQGIGSHKAAVVLEPDALSQLSNPGCLTPSQQSDRLGMLSYAVSAFAQYAPNASVYLDAGHEGAVPVNDMAQRLTAAGVANAAGFALNVANYLPTDLNTSYGNQISALINNKHFVIDTSRNGRGGDPNQWCNVPNQALGPVSQGFSTGLVDAYLWVQNPGNSDGSCNGSPSAGAFWLQQACGLAALAAY